MEFDAFPEPKALSPQNLRDLAFKYGSYVAVGRLIGASECFVRQNQKRDLS